jgi:hypothetical protein
VLSNSKLPPFDVAPEGIDSVGFLSKIEPPVDGFASKSDVPVDGLPNKDVPGIYFFASNRELSVANYF